MNPEENFTTFQDGIFSSILASVKTAGSIAAEDVSFQRSSNPEFNAGLDEVSARILGLANQLLKSASRGSDLTVSKMADVDDVENKWGDVVEVVDYLLEKADTCLDEYTGAIKQKYPEPLPGAQVNPPHKNTAKVQRASSWKSRQMVKPQLKFREKIDNFNTSPFKPLLRSKPHAIVSLEDSIRMEPNEEGVEQFIHPYRTEIESMKYPPIMYEKKPPIKYHPFRDTTAVWVETKEALDEMIYELKQATEIAVDLEHHDTRSYIGFTCLMQISSRDNDWIIDTLALRSELQALNEVFVDPKIIKVLHGCYMDVKWLQRDFGLYLVGLFDTHFAAKALGFPGLGLAYLLKKYVDFHADKQYQLADWRIRPLTTEMFDYARSDTHFLLYVFDCVRNELIDRSNPTDPQEDRVQRVLQDSKEAALKRYERETYDAENGFGASGWYNMLWRDNLDVVQTAVFKAVHQWRDTAARKEDEGLHYVLPKHQIFNLARQMPTDVDTVLSLCTPASHIVRLRASEVADTIRRVKANPPTATPREAAHSLEVLSVPIAAPVVGITSAGSKYAKADIFKKEITIPEIHADKSSFWGEVVGSSKWEAGAAILNGDVSLAIELPQLTAAVFVTAEEINSRATPQISVDPGARAEHEYVKGASQREKEEDIIVVKSLGGAKKRKLGDVVAEDVTSGDQDQRHSSVTPVGQPEMEYVEESKQGSGDEDLEEGSARKKSKKGKKKEKKRRAREQEAVGGQAGGEDIGIEEDKTFEAFDYAKAAPVFNSHKGNVGGKEGKAQKQRPKVFDPYSKSGDAPRGMSRGQRERAGKSHTFKK